MDLETTPTVFLIKERIDTIYNNCSQKIGFSSPAKEGTTIAAVRLDLPHHQPLCTLTQTPSSCSSDDISSPNRSSHPFELINTPTPFSLNETSKTPHPYEPILRKQVKIAIIQREESKLNYQCQEKDPFQKIGDQKTPKANFSKPAEEDDLDDSDTCDSPSSRDNSPDNRDRNGSKGMCLMGHELKNESLENCKTCVKRIASLQKFAVKHKGRLISQSYTEKLSFECESGHTWTCSYKSARKRWCPHCRKNEKVERMNMKEQMLKERERQNRMLQEELFAKARIQAQKETPKQTEIPKPQETKPSPFAMQAQQNLAFIENQTEQYAKLFAEQFMKKQAQDAACTFDQAFIVYKNLFVADNYFQLITVSKSQDEIKAFYRNTLRLLHPDKNSHPDSAKTFQKVHNHYKKYLEKNKC